MITISSKVPIQVYKMMAAAALGDLTELFPINQLKLTGLKYQ